MKNKKQRNPIVEIMGEDKRKELQKLYLERRDAKMKSALNGYTFGDGAWKLKHVKRIIIEEMNEWMTELIMDGKHEENW